MYEKRERESEREREREREMGKGVGASDDNVTNDKKVRGNQIIAHRLGTREERKDKSDKRGETRR